jgi:ADP-heptose:LPS heptosyltransferase
MRVLFVTSTRIGDAILSTGLLNHVISTSPAARVTVACGPAAAPLFRETPAVEQVIAMTKQPRGGHWFSLWRKVVAVAWDKVIDLRGSALAWTLRAKQRTMLGKGNNQEHRLIQIARAMRLDPPPPPRIWITDQTRTRARALLPSSGPILALGPTANWWGKQWPADRFADLTARLLDHPSLSAARVLVLGAETERGMAAPLLSRLPADRTIDLIGKVDLLEAYACLERASLYVGNDSGLMHLAAAAGAPTLGLFGPSPESHYAPWGEFTMAVRGPRSFEQIVKAPDFDHRAARCYMEDLSVDRVFDAAKSLLARVQTSRGLAAQ